MKLVIVLAFLINLAHAAGGISGGGGNVINPTAPKEIQGPKEIRSIIKGSKELLHKFIKEKYFLYRSGSMDYENLKMYSVLFADNDSNLHEVMEEIKLDIPTERFCFDRNGEERDGSIFNEKRKSICISAYSIAKKVDKYEVPVQSAALVMHEYSEYVGLSHEEAVVLQKEVIEELKGR